MIFYFSGTGNTLWAARQLATATAERLVAIAACKGDPTFTLADGERVGFCFPVHGWQPPHIVRDFIRRMDIANADGHYCYALCTCGDSIGVTMEMLNGELAAKGMHADSVFSLVMPESYVALPFMYTDTLERERSKIETAATRLRGICDDVANRRCGKAETARGPLPWVFSHVVGALFNRCLITDKPFKVDQSRCSKCGLCERVCPVGDIESGHGGSPLWKGDGRCTACLSCYHHCPRHAINYGSVTKRRGQYFFGMREGKTKSERLRIEN